MGNTDLDYAHVTQSGFFITVNGTVDTTVIYAGDRWSNNAGNGVGYNQWCPLTVKGEDVVFNSLSQWSLDAVTGTWKMGHGNNHILNPAFEADRISVGSVVGWEGNARNAKGSSGAGNFCLSLGSGAKASQRIPENASIADLPKGTYEMKASVQSSGGACQISISGFGGSDLNKSSNAGSWAEISIPNINISTGKATVSASNTGSGTCLVDNFSLVRTDPVTLLTNSRQKNGGFTFNSATRSIDTYGLGGETIRLEMYSINGKKVLKQLLVPGTDAEQFRLPVPGLDNGAYFLKMISGGKTSTRKITLSR